MCWMTILPPLLERRDHDVERDPELRVKILRHKRTNHRERFVGPPKLIERRRPGDRRLGPIDVKGALPLAHQQERLRHAGRDGRIKAMRTLVRRH